MKLWGIVIGAGFIFLFALNSMNPSFSTLGLLLILVGIIGLIVTAIKSLISRKHNNVPNLSNTVNPQTVDHNTAMDSTVQTPTQPMATMPALSRSTTELEEIARRDSLKLENDARDY